MRPKDSPISCSLVPVVHRPVVHEFNWHHIQPKSWGGQFEMANLIGLCPTHHSNVHVLLNEYVKVGKLPDAGVLAKFGSGERTLAAKAWELRPNDKPPYTLKAGI